MELQGTESQAYIVKWKIIYFNWEVENLQIFFFLSIRFTNNDRTNKTRHLAKWLMAVMSGMGKGLDFIKSNWLNTEFNQVQHRMKA